MHGPAQGEGAGNGAAEEIASLRQQVQLLRAQSAQDAVLRQMEKLRYEMREEMLAQIEQAKIAAVGKEAVEQAKEEKKRRPPPIPGYVCSFLRGDMLRKAV